MSFWPLAKTELERLPALSARGTLVELGSGDGHFGALMRGAGFPLLGIDSQSPTGAQPEMDICADLFRAPLRPRSCGLLVLSTTLRHCRNRSPELGAIIPLLAPQGELWILEDHPEARSPAEQNYRDLLDRLAEVDPSRGSILNPAEARAWFEPYFERPPRELRLPNHFTIRDPARALHWMEARGHRHPRLAESIECHGISWGDFYWQIWTA